MSLTVLCPIYGPEWEPLYTSRAFPFLFRLPGPVGYTRSSGEWSIDYPRSYLWGRKYWDSLPFSFTLTSVLPSWDLEKNCERHT